MFKKHHPFYPPRDRDSANARIAVGAKRAWETRSKVQISNLGKSNTGKKHSLKARRNMSEAGKGRKATDATKAKLSSSIKKSYDKKLRNIRRQQLIGKPSLTFGMHFKHTKEQNEKQRFLNIQRFKLHPEQHPNRIMARNGRVTKGQYRLFKIIKTWYYPDAKLEYRVVTNVRNRFCDVGVPSERLDIEYDGEGWWHQDKIADAKRDRELEEVDWEVIRVKAVLN